MCEPAKENEKEEEKEKEKEREQAREREREREGEKRWHKSMEMVAYISCSVVDRGTSKQQLLCTCREAMAGSIDQIVTVNLLRTKGMN